MRWTLKPQPEPHKVKHLAEALSPSTVKVIPAILISLMLLACQKQKPAEQSDYNNQKVVQAKASKISVDSLLQEALVRDTIHLQSLQPFLFFKSGNIISNKEKNALAVTLNDSAYTIKLYSLNNKKIILDSLKGLDAFPVQFQAVFKDYDFDGQDDIYLQVTVSNGYPLSEGHVITVNPVTQKLTLHPEARNLANLHPDSKSGFITAEEWEGFDEYNNIQLLLYDYKWEHGHLTLTDKRKKIVKSNL